MIKAKSDGKVLAPILLHATIHAGLMMLCLLLFGIAWKMAIIAAAVELVTHFVIDTAKGRIAFRYPKLADNSKKPYWELYGLDQFLHIIQ